MSQTPTRFYGYSTHLYVFAERADNIDFARISVDLNDMPCHRKRHVGPLWTKKAEVT